MSENSMGSSSGNVVTYEADVWTENDKYPSPPITLFYETLDGLIKYISTLGPEFKVQIREVTTKTTSSTKTLGTVRGGYPG